MKVLPNSLRRTTIKFPEFTTGIVSASVDVPFSDAGGALRLTRIVSVRAFIEGADCTIDRYIPAVASIMGSCQYSEWLAADSDSLGVLLDYSQIAVDLGLLRVVDNVVGYVAGIGLPTEAVIPFTEFDRLCSGGLVNAFVRGGCFYGSVRIILETERVEITQDEYMRYFAKVC